MKKDDIIKITIEDVTREGMGVGHFEGMAVFVNDAAPNDRISCKITKLKKSYAIGEIVELIDASDERIDSQCAYFPICGGCSFCHIEYNAELKIKERWVKDALKRIGKLDIDVLPIIGSPNENYYRNKSQFPVRLNESGKAICGFYERGSHNIVNIDDCKISSAEANTALIAIRNFIDEYKISVYDPRTHKGLIRHIYIRNSERTSETLVTIVINGSALPHYNELIAILQSKLNGFCGLLLNINTADTSLVLGKKFITLWGKDHMNDELLGVKFHISPLSFYQVNSDQAERMYSIVREYADLTKDDTVLDLYCGIGTMALIMSKQAGKAIGVELVPQAIDDAELCAKENDIENAEFICADASKAAILLKERNLAPDVIIIDPPRKGCDAETLKAIIELSPDKLIYVSCDPATLARDLKILNENGFKIDKCQPLDMFPRTPHVECVVLMSKQGAYKNSENAGFDI